ncbi:GNAT family N-acetyltransferase [Priestia taiwanensis]|uniref:N-acetyltransferase n=1 Tax=Priestia taiwanensis TaxID=1347902 RepID=A0A917ERF3_9BACI|nr:GNAT family N-acetyltransferase [Priestia taiwanensis]MBM7363945.1 RimJ/RimL family protein N-acetyltransferase [Priestia taiwanensis]GGE70390.1 N-acetyltransferase [Priestia taiwanensis]
MIEIRCLQKADVEAFWKLRLEGLHNSPLNFGSSYEEVAARPFERVQETFLQQEDSFIIGAFEGDQLVGMMGFSRETGKKSLHKGTIWGVYVTEAKRGKGLAGLLLQMTLKHARQIDGLERILLTVSAHNEHAIRLYEKHGFVAYGKEPEALKVDGQYVDEIYMSFAWKKE